MASDNDLPPTQATGPRRRPSAVIDATATEIKSESPAADTTPNPPQRPQTADDDASQSSATGGRKNAASFGTTPKWRMLQPYLSGGISGIIAAALLFAVFRLIGLFMPDSPTLPD
jgi:hypothetical protein